jgi:hypothetical protein
LRNRTIPSTPRTSARAALLSALAIVLLPMLSVPAQAQLQTPGQVLLSKFELALGGVAEFTQNSSGHTPSISSVSYQINQNASTAVGGIATLRYTQSRLLGAEFNFDETVVTQSYNLTPVLVQTPNPFTVQVNMQEYTFGYVAHGPKFHGLTPFASGGWGTMKIKPTAHGGEGLKDQYRMTEYVSAGVDDPIFTKNCGVRVQVRDVFYKAPDFGQNYLTSQAHTSTIEPTFGFYLRF